MWAPAVTNELLFGGLSHDPFLVECAKIASLDLEPSAASSVFPLNAIRLPTRADMQRGDMRSVLGDRRKPRPINTCDKHQRWKKVALGLRSLRGVARWGSVF